MVKYVWRYCELKGLSSVPQFVLETWVGDIQRIFCNGFERRKEWPVESIRRKLDHSSLLGFLIDEADSNTATFGYAIYHVPDNLLNGKALLWEEAICLVKNMHIRGKGLANTAITNAIGHFPNLRFGFIGGRTQNPLVFRRYSEFGKLFPFDITYTSDEGRDLMLFLKSHITDVSNAKQIDPLTGICQGQYSEGRLGNYEVSVRGTEQFELKLKEWEFDRDRGDALIVVAKS